MATPDRLRPPWIPPAGEAGKAAPAGFGDKKTSTGLPAISEEVMAIIERANSGDTPFAMTRRADELIEVGEAGTEIGEGPTEVEDEAPQGLRPSQLEKRASGCASAPLNSYSYVAPSVKHSDRARHTDAPPSAFSALEIFIRNADPKLMEALSQIAQVEDASKVRQLFDRATQDFNLGDLFRPGMTVKITDHGGSGLYTVVSSRGIIIYLRPPGGNVAMQPISSTIMKLLAVAIANVKK